MANSTYGQTFYLQDTSIVIKFDNVSLKLSRLTVLEDSNSIFLGKDSSYIYADIGETILGGQIKVLSTSLTDLKIEQRFETSISISDEGAHCDLIDWRHYYSKWTLLKQSGHNSYKCLNPSMKERERFIDLPLQELLDKVKESCGEVWFDRIKKTKTVKAPPIYVGVSRVFIRVTGKINNQSVIKIIVIEEAMGC